MTEMGLGGGVDCRARRGYHLREADLYVEIVDPATGALRPEGAEGEVVFTTLTRVGMPLIRYRTGDISRFIPGSCPCGTCLRTLAPVRYRLDGVGRLGPGHLLTMADLDDALFPLPALLDFSARLACREGRTVLAVELLVTCEETREAVAQQARDALDALPAVHAARQAGALALSVRAHTGATWAGRPPGKRMIDREGAA
jgi:phenylacetate-coenzyme A ligase PaaK-like adenylate-forming protein